NLSVAQLGYAVMTTFEMHARHLFNVTVFKDASNQNSLRRSKYDTVYTTDVDEDREVYGSSLADAVATQIDSVFAPGHREAVLNYDYGDGRKVRIVLGDIMTDPELQARDLARGIAGPGNVSDEDIRG
ncbi:plasmid pRiA4b ORF-3 family protein, partial [Lacticaseibacillus rhamnosus]|uniref:plasmid pRiA4b ORF-3 family protein n=1 Tax=Lacticaseibacillus rhamnosus TaxID=47715 RepID=UPI000CA8AB0D